jgi:hypothetical protein
MGIAAVELICPPNSTILAGVAAGILPLMVRIFLVQVYRSVTPG